MKNITLADWILILEKAVSSHRASVSNSRIGSFAQMGAKENLRRVAVALYYAKSGGLPTAREVSSRLGAGYRVVENE